MIHLSFTQLNQKMCIIISMKKKYVKIAFTVYMIVLLRYTVFRGSFLKNGFFHGTWNLTLFDTYAMFIHNHAWSVFFYYLIGNIIWFIPLGLFVRYLKPYHSVTVAFAGLCTSFIIEFSQWIFSTGVFEIDDLILNTIGVWIGGIVMDYYLKIRG